MGPIASKITCEQARKLLGDNTMAAATTRRAAAGVLLVSLACLAAVVLVRVGGGRAALYEPLDGQPRDPIVSPLLMGYDAEQGAVNELARVAGGLQGAFSPASQTQLYQGLRGMTTRGPSGGRFIEGPGGQMFEVEALPLSRRQGLADGFEPIGDDKYDDALTREALASYKVHQQQRQQQQQTTENTLREDALRALGAGRQPYAPSYSSGDLDDDEITRKALESYRQELAAPLPEEVEQPVALDSHALPVEDDAQHVRREQGAERKRSSMDKVQRLYQRLQNPRDRAAAAVLVREDAAAIALRSAVDKQMPLQKLEGQMAKELRLTGLKMRDAAQVKQLGEQELARYHSAVQKGETLEASNVHYLKAAHNYAVQARTEVLDAQKRDLSAAKVLAGAPAVLSAAHKAEVRARVTDNAAGLTSAGGEINSELSEVEAARAGEAAAAKERADADENAFVSRVINRVRKERFGGSHPSVKALAEEGAKAHEDIAEASKEFSSNHLNHVRAQKWLKQAKFQDAVRTVTSATEDDDSKAIQDLEDSETEGRTIDAAAREWTHDNAEATYEQQAAKQRELAAAAMH